MRRSVFEHPLFHLLLFLLAFTTMTLAGGLAFSQTGGLLAGGAFSDGFPFSVPLAVILLVHESAHYVQCRRYGIAATLPYFIPSPFVFPPFFNFAGTFGALIRIKEPLRERRRLLDVGAAGPLAGFAVAIPFLIYGVTRARPVTTPLQEGTVLFGYPLAIRVAQLATGTGAYTSLTVHEHPTFMAAWFGLLVTALNLLPIGQLDGGHVLRAVAGDRQPLVSRLVLVAAAAMLIWTPTWAFFGALVALFIGIRHPAADDEHRPLDGRRKLAALLCLLVFLLCAAPVPIRFTEPSGAAVRSRTLPVRS
jgi:membrane-associated protease RseP (regulator of RpoE activity)